MSLFKEKTINYPFYYKINNYKTNYFLSNSYKFCKPILFYDLIKSIKNGNLW